MAATLKLIKSEPVKQAAPAGGDDPELVALCAKYRDAAALADEADAQRKVLRAQLLEKVAPRLDAQLRSGIADSTLKVEVEGGRVLIVTAEKWSTLPEENIAALREAFGSFYSLYCEERESVKLKPGVTLAQLRGSVGAASWLMLEPLLAVERGVAPRKGATAHVAKLYAEGKVDAADNLRLLITACSNEPTVRTK